MTRVEFAEKVLFSLMVTFLVLTVVGVVLALLSSISEVLR